MEASLRLRSRRTSSRNWRDGLRELLVHSARMSQHCRLVFIAGLFALACTPSAESTDKPATNSNEQPSDPPKPKQAEIVQPSQAETNVVELSQAQTKTKLEVTTGTELRYSFRSHASAGVGATFEIEDPSVLEHLRTDIEYEQSEQERADKEGADAATATYVFVAKSAGSTSLQIIENLRGDPKPKAKFAITVVDR